MHHHSFRRLAAATLVAGLLGIGPIASAEILEQILVKVNGEIFTKTDLEARQAAALRQRGVGDLPDAELKKQIEAITPRLLVDTVDEMLMLQRGKELGYTLTDSQFAEILVNIKKENKIESEEQFQAALKQEGLTMVELRKMLEKQSIISRVQQNEVFGRISVTEAEEQRYYDEHPNDFTSPATVTLREILVKVPGDGKSINVGLDEETKAKVEALRAKLLAGADFAQAVADESAAPSKANAGLVGPLNISELNPALAEALKPLKAGEITPVIPIQGGYEIFKVEALTAPARLKFAEARTQIANQIYAQRQRGEFVKYIGKMRESAIIEWKNPELKKLYDAEIKREADAANGS
jgi:peptidyl-prolyl cis-trans isomerase SurA